MITRIRNWIGFALFSAFVAACGGDTPSAPTVPTTTTAPTAQGLTISPIPPVLTVGQQVQLAVTVTVQDGGQKQAASVTWQSSNSAVATVSAAGLLTVTGFGEAQVQASAYGQSTTARAFAPAPPKIKLAVTIDPYGSTRGMCGVTQVRFDMSGSSGTGLRYGIAYDDGSSGSEVIGRHTFACPADHPNPYSRKYSIHAMVTDALDRTDASDASITVLDRLDQMYPGTSPPHGYFAHADTPPYVSRYLTFQPQSGSQVVGTYLSVDDPTLSRRPFTATLTGDNDIYIGLNDGSIHMAGHLVLTQDTTEIVVAVSGGSANGSTLTYVPFEY